MSARPKCPKCQKEYASEASLKAHMGAYHGGYSIEDLKAAGITPTKRDIARSMAGDASAKDVSGQAPESEPKAGETNAAPRTRRPRNAVDPEVEAAKERILRARCERMASLPYSILASVTGEKDIRLDATEKADITEAYVTLAKAKGWEATSTFILWTDALICSAAPFAKKERREALKRVIGMPETSAEPAPEEGKETLVQ